jgi:hypothetical protein
MRANVEKQQNLAVKRLLVIASTLRKCSIVLQYHHNHEMLGYDHWNYPLV